MYQLKISVRNLVESILMTGDIGGEFRILSPERAEEGSRVHRLHQARRLEEDPAYHREYYLKREFIDGDITVTVDGRADGILPGQYIEEIKSTYLTPDVLEAYDNPLHWAQLKFYGCMYLKAEELSRITLKLTYFNIDTEVLTSRDETFTLEELEDFAGSVVAVYAGMKRLMFRWRQDRDESIRESFFPFQDYRPGQREMAVNVYGTIRDSKKMFVQAPTGIGKTISTLFPAVKALREGKTDRIFYLTPKGTGKQIGEETIQQLRNTGAKLRSLTLTSKEKICFMEEVRCEAEYCPYARGYYDKLLPALKDLLENEDSLSRAVVEAYARKHEVCPFEFSLDLSLYADIIIGDYNYAFDPRVYLKRFFDEKAEKYVFLVDEAHNLLDRARSMFSAEITTAEYEHLSEGFARISGDIARKAGRVAGALRGIEGSLPEEKRSVWPEYDPELTRALENFGAAAEKYLQDEEAIAEKEKNRDRDREIQEAFMDTYFNCLAYLRIAELYGRGHRTYAVAEDGGLTYKLFCIDPRDNLSEASKRADAIVFFSATLTPMQYYMELYGGEETDYRMSLASPFPEEHLQVFCDFKVDTRYRVRDQSYEAISRNLDLMLRTRKGNYIAFFPSYRYMRSVHEVFLARYGDSWVVKIQEPGLSEEDRRAVISDFEAPREKSLLYFMVLGGVFAEGIDLPGDRLIGTALIGLGYPQLDYERILIKEHFDDEKGQGFQYAYTYPGLNKITQAGGRVIRGETDKGMILLMDNRYRWRDIRGLLPSGWEPVRDVRELEADLDQIKKELEEDA